MCYVITRHILIFSGKTDGMPVFGLGITHRLIVAAGLGAALLALLRWALG